MDFNGVELSADADVEAVLRQAVAGPGPNVRSGDDSSYEWLLRAFRQVDDATKEAMVRAAGQLLRRGSFDDAEAGVTMLRAWRAHPAQPGALELALVDDSHLRSVGGVDLVQDAWHAAAAALPVADASLRARIRAAALRTDSAPAVVAGLARDDTDWLVANAADVVQADPGSLGVLVFALGRRVDDLSPVLDALIASGVPKGALRLAVQQEVRNTERRDALLAHLA